MLRPLTIFLMLTATSPTLARVGPEIAYSTGKEVYLASPVGGAKVRIFQAKGNAFISSVSLKKDGGAAAFVDNWVVKFISFTASGQQVGPIRSIPTCYRSADVNYRPDGQAVIYHELCGNDHFVKMVEVPSEANPTPTPQGLVTNPYIVDVGSWDAAGLSFVYTVSNETGWEIRRHFLSGEDVPLVAELSPGPQLRHPSISPDGSRVLAADWNGTYKLANAGYVDEYAVASGDPTRSNFIPGQRADYSPTDGRVVYIAKDGRYQYLRYLDTDGSTKQISGSGVFHDVDWGD